MTETSLSFPGAYKLKAVAIYPNLKDDTRVSVNIRNLIPAMTITESVQSDSIRGSMRVVDSSGLLENYPMRGEENVYIEIEDALGNIRSYQCFIYKIDNVSSSNNNDLASYTLHFVSLQRFIADQRRVTSSYNKRVSEIVQDIFNNYCRPVSSGPVNRDSSTTQVKQIVVEDTEGELKVIIPRLTPIQALKFLESRAYSASSSTCSFRFFESADSFYFVTDEFLLDKAASSDKIFEFTNTADIKQSNDYYLQRFANFDTFTNVARVDTFDDLHSGAYRNKVMVLDIVNRVTNISEPAFNYSEARASYFKGMEQFTGVVDKHSDRFINTVFTDENARRFLMVRDFVEENAGQLRGEQYIPQIAANRLAYFKNLDSVKITTTGAGRLDITCGDFIRFIIPEFMHVDKEKELNNQLSGVYMVESITRTIDKEVYTNQYTLVKRNWARDVIETDDRFLLGGNT